MELKLKDLRSSKNPKARIKILQGHFATGNSHINTYIDMSTVKTRHNNAREAAKELAKEYLTTTMVDTIVCLDETEVIGTFLAEILSDSTTMSMSSKKNISVITPEFHQAGQNQQVLILAASVTSGKTISKAIESVLYYGGSVCGICSIFSAVTKIAGMKINTIFTSSDVPDYRAYAPHDCPMCKEGRPVEAIVNSYGYSKVD